MQALRVGLLALLASAGCMVVPPAEMGKLGEPRGKEAPPPRTLAAEGTRAGNITQEHVTPENAHLVVRELARELRDAQTPASKGP